MTLVDDLKPVLFDARGFIGELGLRPYTVTLVVTTWSGSHVGDGSQTTTETPIVEANSQPPKVRFLDDEERAIGSLPDGTIEVGPVTPDFAGGGTSWETLTAASATPGTTVLYRITGPEFPSGALFERVGGQSDRVFGYKIRLKPVAPK